MRGYQLFLNQLYRTTFIENKIKKRRNSCIKCVVRVKNDFCHLPKEYGKIKNIPLEMINYGDIKCNVLIEHNGIRMIGEVQFLLKASNSF